MKSEVDLLEISPVLHNLAIVHYHVVDIPAGLPCSVSNVAGYQHVQISYVP